MGEKCFCFSRTFHFLAPGKTISNVEESVTLDNGGFTALELNSRHLNIKSTFSKKNGTRYKAGNAVLLEWLFSSFKHC